MKNNVLLSVIGVFASVTHSLIAPPIRNLFTFPPNTWIENIATRPNGNLLLTTLSLPVIYTLNPNISSPEVSIAHTFPNQTGISGITEVSPDIYVAASGLWNVTAARAALGSMNIWILDFTSGSNTTASPSPEVKHITAIPNSTALNGLASIPGSADLALISDSELGAVWVVNLRTAEYKISFSSPFFMPTGTNLGENLGINGIKTLSTQQGIFLYFTNSAQGIFGRVLITSSGGQQGPVEVITNVTSAEGAMGGNYDDSAFDGEGNAWIATHLDYVVEAAGETGAQRVIVNETLLLNPTSAAFGRGGQRQERTLYVTNGGVFEESGLVDGGVVAVDLSEL